jgi:hypothetical protein
MIERGLGALREYLSHGYAETFAERFGCTASKIYKVANGKLMDYRVLAALKEEAEANLKITKQINNLNKKIKK